MTGIMASSQLGDISQDSQGASCKFVSNAEPRLTFAAGVEMVRDGEQSTVSANREWR